MVVQGCRGDSDNRDKLVVVEVALMVVTAIIVVGNIARWGWCQLWWW